MRSIFVRVEPIVRLMADAKALAVRIWCCICIAILGLLILHFVGDALHGCLVRGLARQTVAPEFLLL